MMKGSARELLRRVLPRSLGGSRESLFSVIAEKAQGFDRATYGFHLRELILNMRRPPKRIMEIGVEEGMGARVMIEAAKERLGNSPEYYGVDLFEEGGGKYKFLSKPGKEEIKRRLEKLGCKCYLYQGDSTKVLPKVLHLLPKMDFIHIDGGHDYKTVKSDWDHVSKLMKSDTVVVFDDYPMEGVERVVGEIKRRGDFVVMIKGGHAVVTSKKGSDAV